MMKTARKKNLLTLGLAVVIGLSYAILVTTNLIAFTAEISHLVCSLA